MTDFKGFRLALGRLCASASLAAGALGVSLLADVGVTGSEAAGLSVPDRYVPELVQVPAGEMTVADPDPSVRRGGRRRAAPRRLRAALPDRQVRNHLRAVGLLPPGRRL